MKLHIIAAFLCLILIFSFSAVNLICLDRFVESCGSLVESTCRQWDENNTSYAEGSCEKLNALWQEHILWLEATVHHSLLRDAEDAMTEFMLACGGSDEDELYRTAALLCTELEHIKELEKLSIGNIL